jgi:hypothetical protein
MSAQSAILTPLAKELNKQLLKHIAGSTIFCPICSDIMDYRRTVAVSFMRGNNPVATKGCCGTCFDEVMRANAERIAKEHEMTIDIVDGRAK